MFAKLLVSILLFFNPNMRLDAIKAASNTTSFITDVPTIVSLNNSTEMKNACKDIEQEKSVLSKSVSLKNKRKLKRLHVRLL